MATNEWKDTIGVFMAKLPLEVGFFTRVGLLRYESPGLEDPDAFHSDFHRYSPCLIESEYPSLCTFVPSYPH